MSDWSSDVCSSVLIRPMERPAMPLAMMPQTHWIEADAKSFARAWEAEVAEVPAFTDSTIHIVSGLLLPIWKRLPNESTRVYRLQTDTGERIVGRRVSPAWVAGATATGGSTLSPDHAFTALMDVRTILNLAEGLQLRRSCHGRQPHRPDRLHRCHARTPARLWPVPPDHLLEAAHVRADRCGRSRHLGQGAGALSGPAHRRAGGRIDGP